MAALARALSDSLSSAGIELPRERVVALAAFLELLQRWNRVYNLTGVRDAGEIIERHFVESLALRPLLRGTRIADVGTGAGLPGMPLAIAEPDRRFTLIDSRAKRIRFLRHAVGELKLENVELVQARVEHLRPDRPFDTVLARAVAPPAELLELCRPLTVPGSILLLLTSAQLQAEFMGLARDFVVCADAPELGGLLGGGATTPGARARASVAQGGRHASSIVLLERVALAGELESD